METTTAPTATLAEAFAAVEAALDHEAAVIQERLNVLQERLNEIAAAKATMRGIAGTLGTPSVVDATSKLTRMQRNKAKKIISTEIDNIQPPSESNGRKRRIEALQRVNAERQAKAALKSQEQQPLPNV